jgi:ParB family chromosome partitioning protein
MGSQKPKQAGFNLQGRGILGGLVNTSDVKAQPTGDPRTISLPVSQLQPNPKQPRHFFSDEGIGQLAASFQKDGFRGALNVRQLADGSYQIVAGERRWRAAKQAGLKEVLCIVEEYSDEEALEFALVENLQREDLSKLEETEGILTLIESRLGISRDQAISVIQVEGHPDRLARCDVAPSDAILEIQAILEAFSISLQTFRTKNLRTLSLPDALKQAHLEGRVSYSCAVEMSKLKDESKRSQLLNEVLEQKLSFRQVKERVQALNAKTPSGAELEYQPILDELDRTLKLAKRAKTILDKPQKRKRLEKLLSQINELLELED